MMFGNLSVYLSCCGCGYTGNSSLESTSKFWYKGSLKIPKRKYEAVNLRREDITKTKRQNDKQWSTILYTEQRKIEYPKTGGELSYSGRVGSSCFTSDTCRLTVKRHEHHLV